MIKAAGILFLTKQGQALFLKRGPDGDHPGEWCFPGGKQEDGESILECAEREAKEEIGSLPDGERIELARRIANDEIAGATVPVDRPPSPEAVAAIVTPPADAIVVPGAEVDFTTFLQKVDAPFEVEVDGEHTGWAWAKIDTPPEPLHPGCRIALARLGMNELDVAKAIRDGALTSPQQFHNVWLFAIRITGTGVSYRAKHNEVVMRRPENYLTPEFLERVSGLPVVWMHPPTDVLTGNEFDKRIIGTAFVPYVKGDEVWAIAKVFNEAAAEEMATKQLSTSPGVLVSGKQLGLEDGDHLLVEDAPKLVDHIAVLPEGMGGVWDKGGPAAGVESTDEVDMAAKDTVRADADEKKAEETKEERKADDAKKDEGGNIDKLLAGIDSIGKRLDDFGKRMDSMEERMDKRKDADEGKEEKAERVEEKTVAAKDKHRKDDDDGAAKKDGDEDHDRKDDAARRHDSAMTEEQLHAFMQKHGYMRPAPQTDDERRALGQAQARTDSVAAMFGKAAPRPMEGENSGAYRRRMAGIYQAHSKAFAKIDLAKLDDATFEPIEAAIYTDAVEAAKNPVDLPDGEMREHVVTDSTGRRVSTFFGRHSFVRGMMPPSRRVGKFNTDIGRRA